MTLRLRLMCDGQMSEYAFDRARVAVGRGPFNDLVVTATDVASRHGILLFGEVDPDAVPMLTFEAFASDFPTTLVRDGALVAESDGEHVCTWMLEDGDFLLFGNSSNARIEIISVAKPVAPSWSLNDLVVDMSTIPAEVFSVFMACGEDQVTTHAYVASVLRCLEQLTPLLGLGMLCRLDAVVYTTSDEFLDDVFGLQSTSGLETSLSVRSPSLSDPLARLGVEGASLLKRQLDESVMFASSLDVEQGEVHVYFGVRHGDEPAGLVAATFTQDSAVRDDFLALVAHFVLLARHLFQQAIGRDRHVKSVCNLAEENRYFRERERRHYLFKELICESMAMRTVYEQLNTWVDVNSPVFVCGQAGTGKELLARALHHLGARRQGMFISLHCGCLDDEVLGIELFGCVASELDGAVAPRKGVFELAHDGTVYLEEIDLLSPLMQGKLVRMIKEGEVRRVGDSVGRRVRVRLIVSTHHSIQILLSTGALRQDLYLLLKDHMLHVPSLVDRREDLLPLAHNFLKGFATRYGSKTHGFSSQVVSRMCAYDWPGNVRELQSFVEAAVLRAGPDAEIITQAELTI